MGNQAFEHMARLERALNRRGNPLSVDAFMDILREANDSTSQADESARNPNRWGSSVRRDRSAEIRPVDQQSAGLAHSVTSDG